MCGRLCYNSKLRLAEEALPKWQDILFEVERRRAAWLLERNAEE